MNTQTITTAELYTLNGISSNIQTQLNGEASTSALNTKLDNFWAAGRITQAGAISINIGTNVPTINASVAGTYTFTIPAHPDGTNYIVMATPSSSGSGTAFYISTYVNSSTSFTVYTFNSGGNLATQPFMYHPIP